MNILLDAMGGDNAPDANIKGALKAVNQIKATITLIGKEEIIRSKIKEFTGKEIEEVSDRLKIKNATETIEMETEMEADLAREDHRAVRDVSEEKTEITVVKDALADRTTRVDSAPAVQEEAADLTQSLHQS